MVLEQKHWDMIILLGLLVLIIYVLSLSDTVEQYDCCAQGDDDVYYKCGKGVKAKCCNGQEPKLYGNKWKCPGSSVPVPKGGESGGLVKAVIVVRHGEKFDGDGCVSGKPCTGSDINIPTIGPMKINYTDLNPNGWREAESFNYTLPKLIKDNGLAPVTRLVAFTPQNNANAFLTTYPFLIGNGSKTIKKIDLYNSPQEIKNITPTPEDGSILIVGTADSLMGTQHGQRTANPQSGSILKTLNSIYHVNNSTVTTMSRGVSIYVYNQTGNGGMKQYHQDPYKQTYSLN